MLIAVVGPSGVGKDALIAGAKAALSGDPDFVFPLREITRPAGAPGETFVAVDEATFEARRRAGGYALAWRAHGLAYGVPTSAAREARAGKRVVANVSRSVLADVRAGFPVRRIVLVTAARETVERRLRARGRETEAQIAERLSGFDGSDVTGDDVVVVRNDGALEAGVAAFLAAIRA